LFALPVVQNSFALPGCSHQNGLFGFSGMPEKIMDEAAIKIGFAMG
jgi:hypothetical protein